MASKKPYRDNFADLVARLNAMSNQTPDQERSSLMEAATKEPRLLDERDVSLADIAKLAGIKEYVEPIKVSQKAQKMVENITQPQSDITKAIKEADADDSIATGIKKAVTEESKRLDKITELETQLAELKAQEKEDATLDDKTFRERFVSEITEYVKKAEGTELADLYNKFSMNEVQLQEKNFLIKTPETAQVIADAEANETEGDEKVLADAERDKRNMQEPHTGEDKADDKEAEDKADEKDDEGELPMLDKEFDEGGEDVETPEIPVGTEDPQVEIPTKDKFTNYLDPAPKADKK